MADFEDGGCGGGGGGLCGGLIINWVPKLIDTQIDLIADTFTSLTSPNPNPNPNPKPTPPPPPPPPPPPDSCHLPEILTSAVHHLLRRLAHGLLGAVYTGMMLALVMSAAVILGFLVVNYWVEEPVVVKEKLQFDFTDFNPHATFVFDGGVAGERKRKQQLAMVPVGHTFHVSVELLVPDSDYNRDIGVFQIVAEVISSNGKIIAESSQPSMLIYQSHPVRLMHTLLMGFPLLLGLTRETQKITVHMLKCKEDSLIRTEAIRITLMPRARTPYVPQLYEAKILVHSRLPWVKELIHDWKWTFYVWTSLHIYIMLLTLILCFCRPLLVFPVLRAPCVGEHRHEERGSAVEREDKTGARMPEEREFTETLRKWQQYRRKRKAELLSKCSAFMENVSLTSASSCTMTTSYTMTKDTGPGLEEVGDSESVSLDS
ncbi:hypothetical protein Cgig2_032860 [Carnegiea gigantea]|uniref:Seipin n=1 Tax=Carnegiea gigantea TaxID=171969 RepID=A0A9Q1GX28_9CARY|nr:hypothetical protein Cgig2_032860 [Carnegiea gigantea]